MGQSKMDNPEKPQHKVHKTKKNTTQYVLDTTMHKQTQLTQTRHEHSHKQQEVKQ
jgi:hypothetical protein